MAQLVKCPTAGCLFEDGRSPLIGQPAPTRVRALIPPSRNKVGRRWVKNTGPRRRPPKYLDNRRAAPDAEPTPPNPPTSIRHGTKKYTNPINQAVTVPELQPPPIWIGQWQPRLVASGCGHDGGTPSYRPVCLGWCPRSWYGKAWGDLTARGSS